MNREEQLMKFRESIFKDKFKYDNCFVFKEGVLYGEGINEENTKNICEGLNLLENQKDDKKPVTVGDVKYFLGLLFELIESNKPKEIKKDIVPNKPDIKRVRKVIKENLKKIKGK